MAEGILSVIKDLSIEGLTVSPPDFIGGLFPRKHISVIASKPGVGKTWFTLLNIRNITNDGLRCVLLNGESGFDILQYRMKLLNWSIPSDMCAVVSNVDAIQFGGVGLDDVKGWDNVCNIVRSIKADCLFVDSLLAFISKDESDMASMRNVFARLQALATKTNIAVVVNHHLRKGSGIVDTPTIDDFIGSSAISRIACCMFSLTQVGGGVVRVECAKSWYEQPQPISFKLERTGNILFFRNNLGVSLECNTRADIRSEFFRDANTWRTAAQISAKMHIKLRTVQYHLKALVDAGILQIRNNAKEYEYKLLHYAKQNGAVVYVNNDDATTQPTAGGSEAVSSQTSPQQ